jgi:hypothetical protein
MRPEGVTVITDFLYYRDLRRFCTHQRHMLIRRNALAQHLSVPPAIKKLDAAAAAIQGGRPSCNGCAVRRADHQRAVYAEADDP